MNPNLIHSNKTETIIYRKKLEKLSGTGFSGFFSGRIMIKENGELTNENLLKTLWDKFLNWIHGRKDAIDLNLQYKVVKFLRTGIKNEKHWIIDRDVKIIRALAERARIMETFEPEEISLLPATAIELIQTLYDRIKRIFENSMQNQNPKNPPKLEETKFTQRPDDEPVTQIFSDILQGSLNQKTPKTAELLDVTRSTISLPKTPDPKVIKIQEPPFTKIPEQVQTNRKQKAILKQVQKEEISEESLKGRVEKMTKTPETQVGQGFFHGILGKTAKIALPLIAVAGVIAWVYFTRNSTSEVTTNTGPSTPESADLTLFKSNSQKRSINTSLPFPEYIPPPNINQEGVKRFKIELEKALPNEPTIAKTESTALIVSPDSSPDPSNFYGKYEKSLEEWRTISVYSTKTVHDQTALTTSPDNTALTTPLSIDRTSRYPHRYRTTVSFEELATLLNLPKDETAPEILLENQTPNTLQPFLNTPEIKTVQDPAHRTETPPPPLQENTLQLVQTIERTVLHSTRSTPSTSPTPIEHRVIATRSPTSQPIKNTSRYTAGKIVSLISGFFTLGLGGLGAWLYRKQGANVEIKPPITETKKKPERQKTKNKVKTKMSEPPTKISQEPKKNTSETHKTQVDKKEIKKPESTHKKIESTPHKVQKRTINISFYRDKPGFILKDLKKEQAKIPYFTDHGIQITYGNGSPINVEIEEIFVPITLKGVPKDFLNRDEKGNSHIYLPHSLIYGKSELKCGNYTFLISVKDKKFNNSVNKLKERLFREEPIKYDPNRVISLESEAEITTNIKPKKMLEKTLNRLPTLEDQELLSFVKKCISKVDTNPKYKNALEVAIPLIIKRQMVNESFKDISLGELFEDLSDKTSFTNEQAVDLTITASLSVWIEQEDYEGILKELIKLKNEDDPSVLQKVVNLIINDPKFDEGKCLDTIHRLKKIYQSLNAQAHEGALKDVIKLYDKQDPYALQKMLKLITNDPNFDVEKNPESLNKIKEFYEYLNKEKEIVILEKIETTIALNFNTFRSDRIFEEILKSLPTLRIEELFSFIKECISSVDDNKSKAITGFETAIPLLVKASMNGSFEGISLETLFSDLNHKRSFTYKEAMELIAQTTLSIMIMNDEYEEILTKLKNENYSNTYLKKQIQIITKNNYFNYDKCLNTISIMKQFYQKENKQEEVLFFEKIKKAIEKKLNYSKKGEKTTIIKNNNKPIIRKDENPKIKGDK